MQNNAAIVNDVIRNRRSVFQPQFSGEKVPDEVIDQMIENANWAPTHKLTEPWRFIIFTGDGIRQLAEAQANHYKTVATAEGNFNEGKFENLLRKPQLSSHIIAVAMKRDEAQRVPEIEEIGAVFCAVQNMLLTAAAYNMGAYLSTGGITYMKGAGALFDLGASDRLIGFIHVGQLKGPVPDGKRQPAATKVNWVK